MSLKIFWYFCKKECYELKIMESSDIKEIYFAGGCFWGTEHFFKQVRGVVQVASGYANGNKENPTYEEVYTDTTGYAEVVKVLYNQKRITLSLLLKLFFKTIDPTSLNKQGNDEGTRYRTGIYYTNKQDEKLIRQALTNLSKKYNSPIVVECEPLRNFYLAEDWHQQYLIKNPTGYCHIPLKLFAIAKKANPIKLSGKKHSMMLFKKQFLKNK